LSASTWQSFSLLESGFRLGVARDAVNCSGVLCGAELGPLENVLTVDCRNTPRTMKAVERREPSELKLWLVMIRWLSLAFAVALVIGTATIYYAFHVPDLQQQRAADLLSRAPEFNRYARLGKVESLVHLKNSMDVVSTGTFTFVYLISSGRQMPIKARADFRYWQHSWHLTSFDYACPSDCHIVDIDNGLGKSE
jgi:hypothetical protein